jgi:hypothetical protein
MHTAHVEKAFNMRLNGHPHKKVSRSYDLLTRPWTV